MTTNTLSFIDGSGRSDAISVAAGGSFSFDIALNIS